MDSSRSTSTAPAIQFLGLCGKNGRAAMYEVSVETTFQAEHAVTVCGVPETPHEHDWRVVVTVQGNTLDSDVLLVDFIALQKQLEESISPLQQTNLNTCKAMAGANPTAERVAWYIANELQVKLPSTVTLSSVRVTEAPHCIATYRP